MRSQTFGCFNSPGGVNVFLRHRVSRVACGFRGLEFIGSKGLGFRGLMLRVYGYMVAFKVYVLHIQSEMLDILNDSKGQFRFRVYGLGFRVAVMQHC